MGRSNAVILTTAILLAFAAGLLLGRGIDRGETELLDSAGNALVAPQARRAADRPRRAFQSVRAADAPRPAAEGTAGFAFERLRLETDGAAPQACLQFTEDLVTDGSIDYADYIRITPKTTPVVTVSGASACVLGLRFDQDYQIELRPGLPNADGDALERAERFAASFGDKPAYVGFAGDGVILPRLEADGVGLETVNVARLRVEIFRVSDRALARKRILSGGSTPENDYYYVYGEENGEDVGAPIFENVLAIDAGRNETKTTVFALGAALPALRPGAYFVRLKDVSPGADARRPAQAWRWVVFTDLALPSYSSAEGIAVVARSMQSGRSIGEVRLELVAQNNDILARAETSSDGLARFEKAAVAGEGPLAPKMIMAYGAEDDFAVLDLTRGPLDLSDYPIEGRGAPSLIDAYLYLDRGVYRPGETVHIAGLLRNAAGLAGERAASVVIRRPNGVEAFRQRIEAYESGGFAFDYEAPRAAPRRGWWIRMEGVGAGLVGETTFSVEDFVPQRLAVTLEMDETTPMRAGERRPAPVESRYLYGAPAADLTVEGEARVRIDPTRSDYRFGLADERFTERLVEIDDGTTDAAGRATLTLDLGATPLAHTAPLRADFVVGVVEPGGRVVRESARIPVRPNDRYIGLRLTDDKGATARGGVGRGEAAIVEALALDRGGAPVAAELEWRLVEEDVWFDWYRQDGAWRWRRSSRDIPIAEGRATASAEAPAHIAQDLQPGDYRLTARDPATGATSDLRFYVGWRSQEAGAGRPDQAALTVDSNAVAPGGRARLMLDPPYAGEAVVVVATDRVHSVQRFKVEEDGQEIIIDTDPAWGAGFYVLASIVTPRSAAAQPTPRRAMGVAYVPFDVSARTLTLSLDAPAAARPRERLELPVRVDGVARNEEVMLTLAAVDEGILRLTKFASPDPTKYYFGKKRLGVAVRDDYGRILDANLAAPAAFGGDQIGGEGLTVVPQKSVALFSGPVRVDANGEARVAFDVPDFNGELRIMAVAWSAEKLGAASRPLTVRDPVPALLSLPRFLAPGDRAEATLLVDNVDGLAGPFEASLAATGPVAADETAPLDLAPGEPARRPFRASRGGPAPGCAGGPPAGAP